MADSLPDAGPSGNPANGSPTKNTRSAVAVTVAAVALSAIGNVAAYKIVTWVGTPELFMAYSSDRRYLTFVLPVLMFGAGVSLALRIAIRPDPAESIRILYGQLGVAAVAGAALALFLAVVPYSVYSAIVPGVSREETLALLAAAVALNATGMLYAYDRGFQEFRHGAVVMVLANGVFPCLAALFIMRGVAASFFIWAVLCGVLAVLTLLRLPRPSRGLVTQLGLLVRSSLSRVPGEIAYGAVFLIPVVEFASVTDPIARSVFNYAFVLFGLLTAVASPIATVMLPIIGTIVATDGRGAARQLYLGNLALGLGAGVLMATTLTWQGPLIIETLMAAEYVPEAPLLGRLAPAVVGLALFLFLRSIIDGLGERALTSALSLGGLFAYVLTRLATGSMEHVTSVVTATNMSFGVLGLSTTVVAAYHFRRSAAGRTSNTG